MEGMDIIKESKDLCRLCANHDDQMMPIFTGDGLEHNLATKIERYLPITILENDKLPLLVCYQCASTLISWHNLYEGFLLADRKLKEICYDNKDINSQEHKAQRRVSEEICIVTYDSEPDDDNTEVIEVKESGLLEVNENAKEQGSDQFSNERCSTEYASNGMTLPKASVGDDNCADQSALEIKDPSQCTVCFKKLSSARSRNRHMRTQHNVDISLSKECSVVVVLNENNQGPEENTIVQESTSEITTRPKRNSKRKVELINWKIADEVIEENFTCHECEKRFKYKCALREHVKMHLKMFRCNYCTKLFSTEQLKELHSQRRHNERHKDNIDVKLEHLMCSICDKQFMRKSNFTRHLLNHREAGSSKSNVICAICNKIFGSSPSLKRHILVVHEKEDREAHLKQFEKNQKYGFLEKYVKIIDNEKYLQCDQCRFISKKNEKWKFAEHYRIHTGERPFTCDICNKTFRTKRSLRCHTMFVHEGIKKFPCDICGRCFSDKRYTADHRRTHTGERPYVCDLCGKMFKQAASLFVHKEGHEGRKDHECELCGNKFTRRSHLNVHLRRHRGERNHMCSTCGKAFIDSNQLKNHYSVHSQERPHKCELCGDAFKLKKHLKQHFKVHYKPLPPNTISLSQLNVAASLLNPKMTSEDE